MLPPYQFMVSKQRSPHWDHRPFPFPSATNPISQFSAFSVTPLPLIFRYLYLLPHWESWGLQEWHSALLSSFIHPCSPPFPWSEDIRCLSFLVKVIHSYLRRLYSTYFNLSPIFSSSLTWLLLLVQKQNKKCSHLQKNPPRTVYLPHINIHSLPFSLSSHDPKSCP